ncbi:hypothetical protein PMI41_01631 [Phyllobacterium sp. YR531]|nr:hypothetical protein PMI41_01631 [Phyllobacterium sp. YR531]
MKNERILIDIIANTESNNHSKPTIKKPAGKTSRLIASQIRKSQYLFDCSLTAFDFHSLATSKCFTIAI